MATEISCYHIHANRSPKTITFTRFNNFIKVCISSYRTVTLTEKDLIEIPYLFEYYLLSLVITGDTSKVIFNEDRADDNHGDEPFKYAVSTEIDWKRMYFTGYYTDVFLNISHDPFKSQEPKRKTSDKKIRKFIKNFLKDYGSYDPIMIMQNLIFSKCVESNAIVEKLTETVKNETILDKIKILYGQDIFECISKFM
jgi:hypothetical protein